jgi:hypothetical protein
MKLRSRIIWVLGLLLAIASVDAVPDPPAVSPRAVGVDYILYEGCGDVHERRLNSDSSLSSPLDRLHVGLRTESS